MVVQWYLEVLPGDQLLHSLDLHFVSQWVVVTSVPAISQDCTFCCMNVPSTCFLQLVNKSTC